VAVDRRALVIGGQGVLGAFLARGLAAEGWAVKRGGRRSEESRDFVFVDLDRPETVEEAISHVDLTVNCVPDSRLVAERIVLHYGGTLVSIGSLPLAPRLEFEQEGEEGPGLVVLHGGLTPGITTLVFNELLARHPDADELEYAWASSVTQSSGKAGSALVARQLADGKRRAVKRVDFPDPIGAQQCIEWGLGEEGWFGGLAERHSCRAWFFLGPKPVMAGIRLLNRVGALGLLNPRLLAVGRSRVPKSASREPKRDVIAVSHQGRRLGAYAMNGEGDYAMTVGATLAYIEVLLDRRSDLSGVHGAETVLELGQVLPGLDRRGVGFVELSASAA
jgi:NAD(P)-dependent dehydrogenase (short-subunit alcohol dehydrogenase family)